MDRYEPRKLPKKRGINKVGNMYHILFYRCVYDEHVYRDEQQQQYEATGILMASYFGCRPVSMFDTRIKFEEDDAIEKSVDSATVVSAREGYSDILWTRAHRTIPAGTMTDRRLSTLIATGVSTTMLVPIVTGTTKRIAITAL